MNELEERDDWAMPHRISIFFLNRPKVLVPPYLRGQAGVIGEMVKAVVRSLRKGIGT